MLWLASDTAWISEHLLHQQPVVFLGRFGISKHVVGLFVVAVLLLLTFVPIARALQRDPEGIPRGRLANLFEAILLFLRDEAIRPLVGREGDRFLPFLWTLFFFILYSNLLGLFPLLPIPVVEHGETHLSWGTVTPTGQLYVTGMLAGIAGLWWHGLGIAEQGPIAYVKNLVPGGLPLAIVPLMFAVELLGHVVKVVALCIRLWANMFGGHLSLYVIIGLIFMFQTAWVAFGSVPLAVALYLLKILVAFLQAFIFMFLTTLFLGMAVHPEH